MNRKRTLVINVLRFKFLYVYNFCILTHELYDTFAFLFVVSVSCCCIFRVRQFVPLFFFVAFECIAAMNISAKLA